MLRAARYELFGKCSEQVSDSGWSQMMGIRDAGTPLGERLHQLKTASNTSRLFFVCARIRNVFHKYVSSLRDSRSAANTIIQPTKIARRSPNSYNPIAMLWSSHQPANVASCTRKMLGLWHKAFPSCRGRTTSRIGMNNASRPSH